MIELWRDIPGYAGMYQASSMGSIRSLARRASNGRSVPAKMLSQSPIGGNYLAVCLTKGGFSRSRTVHRLVLLAFVGLCPEGMEACHENGERTDNRLTNLRWDTRASNMADKVEHDTHQRGERHGNASITDDAALAIIADFARGETISHVAKQHGVSVRVARRIRNGEAWTHLPRPEMYRRHGKRKLTAEDEAKMHAQLRAGESPSSLAREYDLSETTVHRHKRALRGV